MPRRERGGGREVAVQEVGEMGDAALELGDVALQVVRFLDPSPTLINQHSLSTLRLILVHPDASASTE